MSDLKKELEELRAENVRLVTALKGVHADCTYLASGSFCNKCGWLSGQALAQSARSLAWYEAFNLMEEAIIELMKYKHPPDYGTRAKIALDHARKLRGENHES